MSGDRLPPKRTHHSKEGGRRRKFHPLYEMVDTFVYWTDKVTARAPHVRDAIDIKRVMSYVVLATIPCVLMSWFNAGCQINKEQEPAR